MTIDEFNWESPKLDADDQALVDAYQATGVPLDSLAYTKQFHSLATEVGIKSDDMDGLRQVYRRLLSLRKRGLLPRLYSGPSLSESK